VSSLSGGMHVLHTRMKEARGGWRSEKKANFRVVGDGESDHELFSVRFVNLPVQWHADRAIPVTVEVRDGRGEPAGGRSVSVSRFCHTAWDEYEVTVVTDSEGRATVDVPTHPRPGILSIAAAVEGDAPERNATGWKQGPNKRYGVYRHVDLIE
jgi:hypothetical protein